MSYSFLQSILNRRTFFKRTTSFYLLSLLTGAVSKKVHTQVSDKEAIKDNFPEHAPPLTENKDTAVKSSENFSFPDIVSVEGEPEKAVIRAINLLGGMSRFVKPGFSVFIKPNMGFANPPEWATTTNPEVVLAVVKLVLAEDAKLILIGENPNSQPEKVIDRCGFQKILAELQKVKIFILKSPRDFQDIQVENGKEIKRISVASCLSKCDLIINIPAAKSHSATDISMGLKNLMGLIQDRQAFHVKHDIHKAIADLNRVIKPGLTILDATRILSSGGPAGPGRVVRKNRIVAGTDPVAVDSYGVTLEKWNGRNLTANQVAHILAAHEAGIGEIDPAKLKISEEIV